jgi:Recombination directionality factor-like
MAILDLQRKGQQIGRIRVGQQVAIMKDGEDTGRTRPAKLDTFRFTTGSRAEAEAIAELYGGDVRQWNREWEVITGKSAIGVTVPPRDQVISQHYEMWNAGGCMRRCDSQHEQISNGPCLCPHAEDTTNADEVAAMALKRADMAKLNPPKACKPVTRINVMIPDLPGLGVFRLDTHSYYAAVEIGDSAELMQVARDKGVFLPAILRIDQRQRVAGGETKHYLVVVLEVLTTFRDLATGAIGPGMSAAQLPPAPGQARRAIDAAPQQRQPAQATPRAKDETPKSAQQVADKARTWAKTGRDVQYLIDYAEKHRLGDDLVDTGTEVWEELMPFLTQRQEDLSPEGDGDGA